MTTNILTSATPSSTTSPATLSATLPPLAVNTADKAMSSASRQLLMALFAGVAEQFADAQLAVTEQE